jgi:hypothetical protein
MYRATIRTGLRRRALALVACGVLCGLVAGVGLWGLAAARRTGSTYERYLGAANASDLSVNVNSGERALELEEVVGFVEEASQLPGVVGSATYVGLESMILARDVVTSVPSAEIVGSLDGRFLDQDRVAVVDGRLPRADRSDELLVNEVAAASRGLEVGDREEVLVAKIEDLEAGNFDESGFLPIVGRFDAEIVGIGTFPDDAIDDEYDQIARVLVTPAITERWLEVAGSYVWHGLRLEDPADVDRVAADYRRLTGEGTFVNTLVTADQAADVQQALRPVVTALAALGFAALAAAVSVGAVAATRLTRLGSDLLVLRAIGARPRQLGAIAAAPAALAALLAALVAAATAVALSPLAPVGAIRAVEPDRGVDADGLVLGAGAALVALVLLGAAVVATARQLRVRSGVPAPTTPSLSGRLAARLPVTAGLGIRRGMGAPGAGGAPTRSMLVGLALAGLAVVASLTFGASLHELARDPARYGWATDLALTAGSGYDTILTDEATALADADERIEGLTVVGFTDVELGGDLVPAMAFSALRGEPAISVIAGRLPEGDDEIALGGRTARRLGIERGDEVEGPAGPARVVGLVTFPAIGSVTSAHPAMGEGALLPLEVLGDEGAQPSIAFVDLADGIEGEAVGQELAETFATATEGGFVEPFTDLQPAELDGAEDADRTVRAIALVVGVAALAGLATVVMASVRSGARELAVLRTLGLTARDLRRSVRWQSGSVVVVALAFGIPLGVASGRLLWRVFADALGTDPAPTVPLLATAGLAVAALLLALLAALPAARRAGRLPVAPALRPD